MVLWVQQTVWTRAQVCNKLICVLWTVPMSATKCLNTAQVCNKLICSRLLWLTIEPEHDETNKLICAPSEVSSAWASSQSDQSSLSAWRRFGPLVSNKRTAKTLFRLCGCPSWSESLLGAQIILFVLSCCHSIHNASPYQLCLLFFVIHVTIKVCAFAWVKLKTIVRI